MKKFKSNRTATICVCAGILFKFHFPQVNLIQKIVSLILHAGHCGKMVCPYSLVKLMYIWLHQCIFLIYLQVYTRLTQLGISMSHQRVVALHKACGKDFDASVRKWCDLLQMQCKLTSTSNDVCIQDDEDKAVVFDNDDNIGSNEDSSNDDSDIIVKVIVMMITLKVKLMMRALQEILMKRTLKEVVAMWIWKIATMRMLKEAVMNKTV